MVPPGELDPAQDAWGVGPPGPAGPGADPGGPYSATPPPPPHHLAPLPAFYVQVSPTGDLPLGLLAGLG